ncbi:MAG: hypothetical protein NC131_07200 [Roseburia sp.]|nr:hypothetical protein [Roseburia sp.]
MENSNNITMPTAEQIRTAYANATTPEIKSLLADLFGDVVTAENRDNRPVTERIKSLDDAMRELGDEHPLVRHYNYYVDEMHGNFEDMTDIAAFFKMRIIVAALNEGWQPQFIEDEWRWYPYFVLYTNDEIANLDDEDRDRVCRVVGRSGSNASASGGLAYAYAGSDSAYAGSNHAARLAFKSRELALYAGTQFIEIYRDFIFAQS